MYIGLIWTKDHHHHEEFISVFNMLFIMYDMIQTSHAHLKAQLYTTYSNIFQSIWKKQIQTYWENAHIRSVTFWQGIVAFTQIIQQQHKVWVLWE